MNTSTILVIVIICILLLPAVKGTIAHLKGEGSCCGGPKEKRNKKKIKGTKICEYRIRIDGMHCENCRNRIENRLNSMDGILAKVSLSKKEAIVSCYATTDPDQLIQAINTLGYKANM